jgi:hypothetical protein
VSRISLSSRRCPSYGMLTATDTLIALRSRLQAEEARKRVRGLEENAVHTKYIELVSPHVFVSLFLRPDTEDHLKFAEMKRIERDHAKEKQRLTKDRDTGTSRVRLTFP